MAKKYGVKIDISLLGDAELQKQFDRLEGMGRRTDMLSQAAKAALIPVMETAKANAPHKSGLLRKGFRKSSVKTMRGRRARGLVGARLLSPERAMLGIPATAKGYYPTQQELGSKTVSPTRYMRDALYSNQSRVFSIMRRELYRRIRAFMTKKGMSFPESVDRGASGE